MREQNVNQTKPISPQQLKQTNGPSTFPFKSKWQRNTTQRRRTRRFFIQGTSAARYSVENINFRCWGEEKKTGVLSAFVGLGLICRVSLSSHLLDSISSSVTSADYVSSKQPATWRQQTRYYGERMTTCIGIEYEERGGNTRKGVKKREELM